MKNRWKILNIILVLGLIWISLNAASQVYAWEGSPGSESIETAKLENPYFQLETITLAGGSKVERYIINGPPSPPAGYERTVAMLPEAPEASGSKILNVPAYKWVYGCAAVSAAMIAAYYDRIGYHNMYTGPTNGGIMPFDNEQWPEWQDNFGERYVNNPLVASHIGLDNRSARGSIENYWVQYNSDAPDPYITNGWDQHAWGDAVGDFMKTSQSKYDNVDGATSFYRMDPPNDKLTCEDMEKYEIHDKDGTYGRKLFYEARGYTVTDCYNQRTDNQGGGFTFDMYKAEIDAGRPVLINLEGHSVVGIGYDATSQTVYLNDTWDYETHSMPWGGTYDGMTMYGVSIVNLKPLDIKLDKKLFLPLLVK